ncbi:hypothetical protein [Capnocytophaga leadbetteri]|jgi:hypothetical protein
MKELVFNIWFVVDIASRLSKTVFFKPYCLEGSDEEKLDILKKLAETDYFTCERLPYTEIKGNPFGEYIPANMITTLFEQNNAPFIDEIEKNLPLIYTFGDTDEDCKARKLKFTEPILYNYTFLFENEYGLLIPSTTAENKAKIAAEQERINIKFLYKTFNN